MLEKKDYQEKLFLSFSLSDRIPENNFYRRLKSVLDLQFVRNISRPYYGTEGQKSIDPTVFFRLMLVGYLENIVSDRQLVEHVSMRLDLLYFIDYDIDEALPWHSTLSRTRKPLPNTIFEEVFDRVLGMRKINTRGIESANKVMIMAAIAYNLKKLPKHNADKRHLFDGIRIIQV